MRSVKGKLRFKFDWEFNIVLNEPVFQQLAKLVNRVGPGHPGETEGTLESNESYLSLNTSALLLQTRSAALTLLLRE